MKIKISNTTYNFDIQANAVIAKILWKFYKKANDFKSFERHLNTCRFRFTKS